MVPKLSFQLTQICMALLKRLSCIKHVADFIKNKSYNQN